MANFNKNLTKGSYLKLLTLIGESPEPLSAHQITKKMGGSKYTYEMIKALCGVPTESYDELLHNPKYEKHNRENNPEIEKEFKKMLKKANRGLRYLKVTNTDNTKKYALNFRGFLLFLYYETKTPRASKHRIHAVISNPWIQRIAPFLRDWKDFEGVGYNVTNTLKEIGSEYQNQFDSNIDYLLRQVSNRYFTDLSNWFVPLETPISSLKYLQSSRFRKILKEYRLFMFDLQRAWLREEILLIDRKIEYYSS